MADKNIASDMSGRPIRRATQAECLADDVSDRKPYDMIARQPDGTKLAYTNGRFYPIKADGHPDFDREVKIP